MKYVIALIVAAFTYLFYGKQKAEQQLRAHRVDRMKASIKTAQTRLDKQEVETKKKRKKYEEALFDYNTRYRPNPGK